MAWQIAVGYRMRYLLKGRQALGSSLWHVPLPSMSIVKTALMMVSLVDIVPHVCSMRVSIIPMHYFLSLY